MSGEDPSSRPEVPGGATGVVRVSGGRPLVGTVSVPGDKSISHRALLVGALAPGTSTVTGLSNGDDVARTRAAVEALGARIEEVDGSLRVTGGTLHVPPGPLDLGNSGTGLRLLMGVVAGLPGSTTLTGDASLRSRPMDRVARPLALMGATASGTGERCLPPVTVTGGRLVGIDYTPPVASAQVKSAILLAGLAAAGPTVVREPVATRSHTEELLAAAGADVSVERSGGGVVVTLRPGPLRPFATVVPGDPSQAAFWVVAATLVPGSDVAVRGVHVSPERTGFLDVLDRMGARVAVERRGPGVADLRVLPARLSGTEVLAAEIPSLDEVPILAVAAAAAAGRSRFRDVGELRVKESDRLTATAALVRAIGARASVEGDDLVVDGVDLGAGGCFYSASVDAELDHRMAMAAAVAGMATTGASGAPGGVAITGWDAVATSYPAFLADLDRLTGTTTGGRL